MTTWLEFRSEPLIDVPEVDFYELGSIKNPEKKSYIAVCSSMTCSWIESSLDSDEIDELAETHQDWHENGMPE